MRLSCAAAVAAALGALVSSVPAEAFCTNPNAIGVSRVLKLDTTLGLEVGRNEFHRSLALQPKEVVLTFDDGPNPGTTDAVLSALEHQCTRATFFLVGRMALGSSHLVLAEEAAGHTIGTHTWGHPLDLQRRPAEDGIREIDDGIRAIAGVLGHEPAPFFRFPGLGHTSALRAYLTEHHIGAFSIDAEGGDWLPTTPDQIRLRALSQLRANNGGILLLHDTKTMTAAMLPQLLADLQAEGFKIVQIVPSDESLVASATTAPTGRVKARHAVTTAVATAPVPGSLPAGTPPPILARNIAAPPRANPAVAQFGWSWPPRPFDPFPRTN